MQFDDLDADCLDEREGDGVFLHHAAERGRKQGKLLWYGVCDMEYGIWGMKYGVCGMEYEYGYEIWSMWYEYRVWNRGCGVWRMGHQFHVGHLELAESGSTEYQVKETVVVRWTHLQHRLTSLRGEGRKRREDG